MVRLACAEVRRLDLQLLLRRQPQWQGLPVAVVSRDSPQGTICAVNRRAAQAGVCPGLSYAAGLSFTPELRGGVVSRGELAAGVQQLEGILQRYSPGVEACAGEPGVFWLDIRGLEPLYPSVSRWSQQVREALRSAGFHAVLAAGFTRFGCYAAAKAGREDRLFGSAAEERASALDSPLEVLTLAPEVLERLRLLGVRTVGAFLALPPRGLRKRFGLEAERMHAFAAGDLGLPVLPATGEELLLLGQRLPDPAADSLTVRTALERTLEPLLEQARHRRLLVRSLGLRLLLDGGEPIQEEVAPAAPTRDSRLLRELVALRLERLQLPAPVAGVELRGLTVPEGSHQRELFGQVSERAQEEAVRAFARLQAVYGADAVRIARLEDEHLPERSFTWESPPPCRELAPVGRTPPRPTSRLATPRPTPPRQPPPQPRLVRRFLERPQAPGRRRLRRRAGPFLLSGRWWAGEGPRRYSYAEDGSGELLWVREDAGPGGAVIGVVE